MLFLNNIDLNKNELQNARVHFLASAPSNPVEGQIYYNSQDHGIWVYNGTRWSDITNPFDNLVDVELNANVQFHENITLDQDNTFTHGTTVQSNSATGGKITDSAVFEIEAATKILLDSSVEVDGINTFSTGTGAVSLNGDTTLHSNKKLFITMEKLYIDNNVVLPSAEEINTLDTVVRGEVEVYDLGAGKLSGGAIVVDANHDLTGAVGKRIRNIAIDGKLTVDNSGASGGIDLNGELDVSEVVKLAASGVATTVRGTLQVDEAATFSDTVTVNAGIDHNGNMDVSGTVELNTSTGTTTIYGDTTIGSNATPTSLVVKKDLTVGISSATDSVNLNTSLNVAGDSDLNGELDVAQTVSLASPSHTTTIRGDAQIDGHLTVGDSTTFGGGTSKNITVWGDLTVKGTTTQVDSTTVNVGDNNILLNDDNTAHLSNTNGGISIKRFGGNDVTRQDAILEYDETANRWTTTGGEIDTAQFITAQLTNKITSTIGDGTATSISVTHNLNTRDVTCTIREANAPYAQVYVDAAFGTNAVTFEFASAPAVGEYVVTIIG